MRKVNVIFLAILLVFTMAFTGCNSSKQTSSANKVSIKYAFWGSPVEEKTITGICNTFMQKHPNIKVDPLYIPDSNGSYAQKMTTMVAANNAPDMAYLSQAQAYQLAESGKLYNIYDKLNTDPELKKSDFVSNCIFEWAPGKAIGRRIGIAAYGLYYNVDALKKANITLPTKQEEALSWDEFVKVCQKLTIDNNGKTADQAGFDPKNVKQYGFTWENWWVDIYFFMQENGADYVSSDGTQFTLDSPKALEVIQNMADLINKYHVAPTPVEQENLPSIASSLASGKIAMQLSGNWVCADLSAAKVNFNCAILPKMATTRSIVDCGPIGIFNSSKHLDETWQLYKFAADPNYCLDFYTSGVSIPVKKDWLTNPDLLSKWAVPATHPSGYIDSFVKPLYNDPAPSPADYIKNWQQLDDIVEPAIQNIFLGKASAKDGIAAIKSQAQSVIKGRYNWSE